MRVFIASLATETNTFAPFPTGLGGFEEYGIVHDASQTGEGPFRGPMRVFRGLADQHGDEVIESLSAFAQPSGKVVRDVYERLREVILADLVNAGALDVVLFMLHGAMVAEGYDDCEGDLIARARAIAPQVVMGVELDPHCHLTQAMTGGADLIVIAKEYPHVDFNDRAHELFQLCRRTALGEIQPVGALVDTRLIGFYPTFEPPMSQIVSELKVAETQPCILSASIAHGFPWADVADVGTRVLVYANGNADAAAAAAMSCARRLYTARYALAPDYPDIATSLDRAVRLSGRVVLGDFADNPGGGAPGDSTFFLREMLERRVKNAVMGCFWDPAVVDVCTSAGTGARLAVRLGGKCGPTSGDPIDLTITVMSVVENHSQGMFGSRTPMGRCVWLRSADIDIAVSAMRSQVFEPDALSGLGIDLADKRLIVVKSSNHYQAAFRSLGDHLWHVCSPGALSLDFASLPYTQRDSNYFPKIESPWAKAGEPKAKIFKRAGV